MPAVDPDADCILSVRGGDLLMPLADALAILSAFRRAEAVRYDWSTKQYHIISINDESIVTLKLLSPTQRAMIALAT